MRVRRYKKLERSVAKELWNLAIGFRSLACDRSSTTPLSIVSQFVDGIAILLAANADFDRGLSQRLLSAANSLSTLSLSLSLSLSL